MPTISMGKSPKPEQSKSFTPTAAGSVITPDAGYTLSQVTVNGDADLVSANIKSGANIFDVAGTFTSDATAVAGDMLSGKTGYVNGVKITGTIASKGAQTYTPGTSNQTISAGQYLSGAQTIAGDADLTAANIKSGVNIFGVAGTAASVASVVNKSYIVQTGKSVTAGRLVGMEKVLTASLGTAITVSTSTSTRSCSLSSTAVLLYWFTGSSIQARIATISGTSVSVGSVYTIIATTGYPAVADNFSSTKVILVSGNTGVILTISGSTISVGSAVTLSGGSGCYGNSGNMIMKMSATQCMLAGGLNSFVLSILTFNGTTSFSQGSTLSVSYSTTYGVVGGYNNGKAVIICCSSDHMICYKLTISGTTITKDGGTTISSGNTSVSILGYQTNTHNSSYISAPVTIDTINYLLNISTSNTSSFVSLAPLGLSNVIACCTASKYHRLIAQNNYLYVGAMNDNHGILIGSAISVGTSQLTSLTYIDDNKCLFTYWATTATYTRVVSLGTSYVRNLENGDDIIGVALTSASAGSSATIEVNV